VKNIPGYTATIAVSNPGVAPARLYFVDWLRVLAMISIFLFHNARFYDVFTDWQVKNATTSFALSIFPVAFMNEWLMPLFFLIAGASTFYSLKSRL
jgi:glucan biosynthesis protein C